MCWNDHSNVVGEGNIQNFMSRYSRIFWKLIEEVKLVEMNRLGPGQYFGERACIRNTPRQARIKWIMESSFAVINKDDYVKFVKYFDDQK